MNCIQIIARIGDTKPKKPQPPVLRFNVFALLEQTIAPKILNPMTNIATMGSIYYLFKGYAVVFAQSDVLQLQEVGDFYDKC